ncbi:MAG: beta strand repeat-containing protein, partial [Bacteroidia bacterium]
ITATGTLSLANFGTSGTYGTATNVPQITVDQYGRVSNINTLPITGLLPAGATDQILYYNGASWVGSTTSNFKFNGTGVGIGIATAPTVNLDVASSSTLTTINTVNSSSGAGIIGANSGTGNGGKFMTTNSANTNAALLVQTNSTSSGAALTAVSTGNGPAIISNGPLKLGGVVLDNTSSAGNIGDVLQSQGVGTIPKWQSPAGIVSAGGGWTTTGNTGTTASSAAIGSAANNNFIGTIDAKDFVIASGGFERMRITSGGNIGVGVVAPATNFHVVNSNPEIRVETPGGAFTAGYGIKTASQQWFIGQETGGSGVLRFKDVGAGVTRMQIASSTGYVGINTTSASDMLDVVSTTTAAAVNGSSSGSGTALVASNSGSGAALTATISNSVSAAATITSSNSANTQPALSITQAGSGKGLYLQNNGGGYGGYFYTPSPNTSNAIFAQQDGTGSALTVYQGSTSNSGAAGFFNVTQATNNANAIYANTSGTGAAVYATAVSGNAVYASNGGAGHTVFSVNGGTGGDAGYFQINNVGSNNDVIFANHTGSGHGVNVAVLGGAAVYARNNSATIATMDVMNGGGAPAGVFVTGSGNNADALKGNAGGTGNAVVGTNSSSGASSGGAGFFSNTNSGNTANALVANTAGTGFAAAFNGGQGLKTDGLTASMRTITANTTLAGGDCFIFVSAAGITVTLPQANVNPGRIYILMNPTTTYNLNTGSGSSAVIGPNGTIVVNASSSSLVGGGTVYRLVSDGTNWRTW